MDAWSRNWTCEGLRRLLPGQFGLMVLWKRTNAAMCQREQVTGYFENGRAMLRWRTFGQFHAPFEERMDIVKFHDEPPQNATSNKIAPWNLFQGGKTLF
jgi:hypothetical protein